MIQQIFLVVFCFISFTQSVDPSPAVTSVQPLVAAYFASRNITFTGYFPLSGNLQTYQGTDAYLTGIQYSCYFNELEISVTATYIDTNHILCKTPVLTGPQNVNIYLFLYGSTADGGYWQWYFSITNFNFAKTDICYATQSSCQAAGDPHVKPFCSSNVITMQPAGSTVNLVTSNDNRFVVYGKTTNLWYNGATHLWVCNLYAISIVGPGTDGKLENITLTSPISAKMNIYLNTVLVHDQSIAWPGTLNYFGITISKYFNPSSGRSIFTVTFPDGEIVDWDTYDTVNIYLPGSQYWRNVAGICGQMDATNSYCLGSNYIIYNTAQIEDCAKSWIVQGEGRLNKRIAQDSNITSEIIGGNFSISENFTIFYQNSTSNITIQYSNVTSNSSAFVVSDNFLSKAATNLCVYVFETLSGLCPANHSQNLPHYQTSCIYDGSALLTIKFNQLSPSTDIDSFTNLIGNVKSYFANAEILGETILDAGTFSFLVSSFAAGIHDCFYQTQNLTVNGTSGFDSGAFYSSLPGCSSYCTFPGAYCSENEDGGDECHLSLTLEQVIDLADGSGSPIIQMNVIVFIGSLLLLSIW